MEIPDTGAVFTWGRSKFSDNQPSHFFIRNDPVVDISCGDEHTILVCQKGRVFVFGSNGSGQLGLGHTREIHKPTCVKALKPWAIALSACGRAHSLFATKHSPSLIFSCGANADGELGLGDHLDRSTPTQINWNIQTDTQIVALAAGSMHSALLTASGEVWTWGNNTDGQCGITETGTAILVPTKVSLDAEIISLACGYYHSLCASQDTVWAFGEGDSGKLGLGNKQTNQTIPQKINWINESKVMGVAAGGSHSLVLTDTGSVFGFGNNFSGQLGIDNSTTVGETVTQVPFAESVIGIACGESHSALLTESGQIFTCGDSRYGKLGHEGPNLQTAQIASLSDLRIFLVKCGGCHTVALASPATTTGIVSEPTSAALPPIKLKRHSLTVVSPSISPLNDDDETVTLVSEKISDDDDNDVEQEDSLSQTESAHGELAKEPQRKAQEKEEKIEAEKENTTKTVQNKLLNRFRKAKKTPESKTCLIL